MGMIPLTKHDSRVRENSIEQWGRDEIYPDILRYNVPSGYD